MNIRIKGLDEDTFTKVNETFGCGRWYLDKSIVYEGNVFLVDVTLNTLEVILKTHGSDQIMLDKGGVKAFINASNFMGITIV